MMSPMITPRIKPSSFWRSQPGADLFVQDQRQAKLGGFIANLAAMDELIDFAAIAARVDAACPREGALAVHLVHALPHATPIRRHS